jgi:hypothetical protein
MPHPADIRVGVQMGLILMMQFAMHQIGGHHCVPPLPARLHRP